MDYGVSSACKAEEEAWLSDWCNGADWAGDLNEMSVTIDQGAPPFEATFRKTEQMIMVTIILWVGLTDLVAVVDAQGIC
jgi:hypothetical protein